MLTAFLLWAQAPFLSLVLRNCVKALTPRIRAASLWMLRQFADLLRAQKDFVEAVNGNIKTLLRRGRGYKNLAYLLLKAQRMAVTKTEFIVLQKAA